MSTLQPAACPARRAGPHRTANGGRRWLAGVLSAALAGGLTSLTPLVASAAACTTRGGVTTCIEAHSSTGAEQTFTVPAGITTLQVDERGGSDGAPQNCPGGVGDGPATVMKLTGDGQTVVPGATFPDPLALRVLDCAGNPVEGAPVTFAVTSGSAILSTVGPEPTNARGAAAAILQAGNTPGQVTVLASVPGTAGTTFRVTVAATAPQPRANLAVSVTGPRRADARSTVRYTVSVSNRGPSDAQDVAVVFGATGIRVNGAVRTIRIGRTTLSGASWIAAVLPAGGSVSHTFTGRVIAKRGRMLVVAAGAIARGTPDPALGNNVAVRHLRVR